MNERFLYNTAIINKLQEIITKYPDWRFGQILWNCGILYWDDIEAYRIHDPHNDEPKEIWNRMLQNKICFPDKD